MPEKLTARFPFLDPNRYKREDDEIPPHPLWFPDDPTLDPPSKEPRYA